MEQEKTINIIYESINSLQKENNKLSIELTKYRKGAYHMSTNKKETHEKHIRNCIDRIITLEKEKKELEDEIKKLNTFIKKYETISLSIKEKLLK
jgi:vacuolar-type H+-ATPase subunit I/STV1